MQMYYVKEGMGSMGSDATGSTTGATTGSTTGPTTDQIDALKAQIKAQMADGSVDVTTGSTTGSTNSDSTKKSDSVSSADQLSADPTRKQRSSNSMLNTITKGDIDNAQPSSQETFKTMSQLQFAPF